MREKTVLQLGFKKIKTVYNLPLGGLFELWIDKDLVYLTGQSSIFGKIKHLELNINNEQELSSFIKCLRK